MTIAEDFVTALCAAALSLGVHSLRSTVLAVRAARAAAALAGRDHVIAGDAAIAARLVLAARATMLPVPPEESPAEPEPPTSDPPENDDRPEGTPDDVPLDDIVLASAAAAIPPGLLAQLQIAAAIRSRSHSVGRAGLEQQAGTRGRPAGVRRGEPRRGARINVVATLRAAAPWQSLRRRAATAAGGAANGPVRVEVRRDDFRVTRYRQRSRTTTIFVVDASGSAALHRLGEAKGAVELLLADCYVRRDRVALLAFRGPGAEVVLPPTRSLARAKRSLAGLPGGGGTPLASGIEAANALADAARRQGDTPVLVFLTDGRANLTRDGKPNRAAAESQAFAAARQVRAAGFSSILVDTAPRPQQLAERLAGELGARYLPLPHARSSELTTAIRGAADS